MFGPFQSKPDFTTFTALPNRVPLTEGVTPAPACGLDTLGTTGAAAAKVNQAAAQAAAVPTSQAPVAALWESWSKHQRFTGNTAVPDYANPEQKNRYTWYRSHGWTMPYPGDSQIYSPSEVPGGYVPNADSQ